VRRAHAHITRTTVTGVQIPHTEHLQEVANLVWISGGSEDEIVAAWLHDTIEDTSTTLEEIEENFGSEVAKIVDGLTDKAHYTPMPLPERKRAQAERLRTEDERVRRVKIADQTSNVRHLAMDPTNSMTVEECRQYVRGAKLLADECRGISPLLDELFDTVHVAGLERYPEE
jgi:guanosine-3',5'-bis(diphosphate) 3'-pyrophosphohydrolase